jgi:DNA-binding ferritin-like protein
LRLRSARPAATLDDLLAEARALRTDVNRAVVAGVRAQVLATRLGVQEQRIRTVADRIAEAQRALASAASERRARIAHLTQLQDLRRVGNLPAGQGGDVDEMMSRLSQDVEQSTSDLQALRDAEQELRRTLSAEQNLWSDISSRLEALEHSLPAADRP